MDGRLAVEGLTRRYPGAPSPAVRDVSFSVKPGELLALVGASGSGKTTTLRMIAGFEPADAGRVLLATDGTPRDITRDAPQKRGFGMVFQHYALFPHMTVEENVAFGLEARGVSKRDRLTAARTALGDVGLGEKAGRQIQALSGGEQQRVALARALVIQPPVLLLDEPLSNLDPALRQNTREQLRDMLRARGVTAVFVTHDQEDAFAVADRIAMLKGGVLQQIGTPEALYHTPASADVARFIGRAALVPGQSDGTHVRLAHRDVAQSARIAVPDDGRAVPTGSVLAVVRPESLALSESAESAWHGIVRSRRFAGGHFVYQVSIDEAHPLLEVPDDDGRWTEGDRVGVVLSGRPVAVVNA